MPLNTDEKGVIGQLDGFDNPISRPCRYDEPPALHFHRLMMKGIDRHLAGPVRHTDQHSEPCSGLNRNGLNRLAARRWTLPVTFNVLMQAAASATFIS